MHAKMDVPYDHRLTTPVVAKPFEGCDWMAASREKKIRGTTMQIMVFPIPEIGESLTHSDSPPALEGQWCGDRN